jgi:peptidoglycan/xylan/chitin deacetylase (PgdA/CDA1 family)
MTMSDARHLAFDAAFGLIHGLRLDRLAAPLTRGRGAILMLHHVRPFEPRGFAPNRILEVTPAFLDLVLTRVRAHGFDMVSLDDLAARLADPRARPAVAITLDDGYRDNIEHALPVFEAHRAPFTVFAVPGFVEGTAPLWWLDLEDAIARWDRIDARLPEGAARFETATAALKMRAFKAIYWSLRKAPEPDLRDEIARLAALAGIDPLARTRRLCLDLDGLRRLAAHPLATIGAHTMTHPMLAKHDASVAEAEMALSRDWLQAALQRPVRHIAYPVGDPGSAGRREFDLATRLGFATGVTTRPGMLFAEHSAHLTALPRLSVNGLHQTRAAIDALLSGLPFALINRFRRVNTA